MKTIILALVTFSLSLNLFAVDYIKMYGNNQYITISKYKAANGVKTLEFTERYKLNSSIKLRENLVNLNKAINTSNKSNYYDSNDESTIFFDESQIRVYHNRNYNSTYDIQQALIFDIMGESQLATIKHVNNEYIVLETNKLLSGTYFVRLIDRYSKSFFGKFFINQ